MYMRNTRGHRDHGMVIVAVYKVVVWGRTSKPGFSQMTKSKTAHNQRRDANFRGYFAREIIPVRCCTAHWRPPKLEDFKQLLRTVEAPTSRNVSMKVYISSDITVK